MAVISKPTLPRVTVIGAGVCGLLLAHGLQKLGFPVTVLEKELYLGQRSREWTMTIHWGLATLQEMLPESVLSELRTAHTDIFYRHDPNKKEIIPFCNGYTGEVAFTAAHVFRRVSRTRLRGVLATSGDLDIHWGCEVIDIAHDAKGGRNTVQYKDSEGSITTEETDIVIGADGPSSFVRRWLLGEELSQPKPSRYAIGTGIVKYDDPELAKAVRTTESPLARIASLPNGFIFSGIQNVLDPKDPSTWSFHVMHLWRPSDLAESDTDTGNDSELFPTLEGPASIALVKRVTSSPKIQEPFRSSMQEIPRDSSHFWVSWLHYWATMPWDGSKNVTLLGDAAHSVLPSRGQGLNHGLGDVEKFITEFRLVKSGEQTVTDALRHYHDDVFVRGRRAALESLEDTDGIAKIVGLIDTRASKTGLAA